MIAYRAFCYEWYTKNSALSLKEGMQFFDSGRSFIDQLEHQHHCKLFFTGIEAGAKDLATYKLVFDEMLISKNYERLRYIGFEFDRPPSAMGAGGFCPLEDFSGNALQDLTNLDKLPDTIYYSSFSSENRGILCFVWLEGYGDACEKYIQSFIKISNENKAHEMVNALFDHSENLFLKPDWWDNLSTVQQENLMNRFTNNNMIVNIKLESLQTADWNLIKTIISI